MSSGLPSPRASCDDVRREGQSERDRKRRRVSPSCTSKRNFQSSNEATAAYELGSLAAPEELETPLPPQPGMGSEGAHSDKEGPSDECSNGGNELEEIDKQGRLDAHRDEEKSWVLSSVFLNDESAIRRHEFVQIILQALHDCGFERSVESLEFESGICLYAPRMANIRNLVLQGLWDKVCECIPTLPLRSSSRVEDAIFLVKEFEYIEALVDKEISKALRTLRKELAPLNCEGISRIPQLASLIRYRNPKEIFTSLGWDYKEALTLNDRKNRARENLLKNLQALVPPEVFPPDKRLQVLLERTLEQQQVRQRWVPRRSLSLLVDDRDGKEQIPSCTACVLRDHEDEVWHIQFSHCGNFIASVSKSAIVFIWQINITKKLPSTSDEIKSRDKEADLTIASSEGMRRSELQDDRKKNFDVEIGASVIKRLKGHSAPTSFVAWSPDDSKLISCSEKEVVLWDVARGHCLRTVTQHSKSISSVAWMPDGKRFISGGMDHMIYMWDVETGKLLDSWTECRVNDLAISADGKSMIILDHEGPVKIIELTTNNEKVIQEKECFPSMTLSKDSNALLLCGASGLRIWDTKARKKVKDFVGHKQDRLVLRACFGGVDQALIASGSEDSKIYIWHRQDGKILRRLEGHSSNVNSVAWSPKNPYLFASASDDHTIRLWSVKESLRAELFEELNLFSSVEDPVSNGLSMQNGKRESAE